MIKPILMYCSEIWSADILNSSLFLQKMATPMEKVHLTFCKYILKVNSKATNIACLLELGRYPLIISGIKQLIKYWIKIKNMSENTLSHEAYQLGIEMDESGINNWVTSLKKILNYSDKTQPWVYYQTNESTVLKDITDKISKSFEIISQKLICDDDKGKNHKNKLRTYRTIKNNFAFENYLSIVKNPYHRSALTKLRISAHVLEIERGRHKNMDIEKRICPVCDQKEIEDEKHFLLKCKLYKDERECFFNDANIKQEEGNFTKILSTNDEKIIIKLAKFIYKNFELREKNIKKSMV